MAGAAPEVLLTVARRSSAGSTIGGEVIDRTDESGVELAFDRAPRSTPRGTPTTVPAP